MKIIEALKKIKHIDRKIAKNRERISKWCSFVVSPGDPDKPLYDADEIRSMLQANGDMATEKVRIRHSLHKTNISTTAEFNGKVYTVDELLLMQAVSLPYALGTLNGMSRAKVPYGQDKALVITQYDPKAKDKEIDYLERQAADLNDLLDMVSLETDVIEN